MKQLHLDNLDIILSNIHARDLQWFYWLSHKDVTRIKRILKTTGLSVQYICHPDCRPIHATRPEQESLVCFFKVTPIAQPEPIPAQAPTSANTPVSRVRRFLAAIWPFGPARQRAPAI